MNLYRRFGVSVILVAGLSLMGISATSLAQGKKDPKKDQKAEPQPAGLIDWNEKKIAFEMRGKEWRTVFEWLADQTGMPYASPYPAPAGTFTFINPTVNGKPREYTLAEAFDIINEILQGSTKHTLIRRDVTLTMFPADAEIPEFYFPRVDAKDLTKRGKTEIVRTHIIVRNQDVDLVAGTVKKLLGEFGTVLPLPETNELVMRGTVQSLMLARELLDSRPGDEPSAHTHTHKCIYMRANAAQAILTQNLGSAQSIDIVRMSPKDTTVSADGPGSPFQFGKGGKDGGFGGGGGGGTRRIVKPHTVTTDRATNTVIISGPADKISQAKTVLAKIDVPRFEGDKGIIIGPPEFQNHDLPGGGAETTAKLLTEVYKDEPSVRIQVSGPSRLFVHADPQTHMDLKKIISTNFQPTQLKEKLFVLGRSDPTSFAEMIKAMIKDGPYVDADKDNGGIRVRGTEEQLKEVERIIRAFDESPFTDSHRSRMISLEKGSGATVAEALYLLLPKMRPNNEFKLVVPSQNEIPDFSGKKDDKKDKDKEKAPKTEEKKSTTQFNSDRLRELMYVTSQGEKEGKQPPVKKGAPVIITGFGNKIMITSDDPEALDLAHNMIRILVNTEAGPGDFEVVRLRVANAVEVAKILDEAFNGKAGPGPGGGGRGPGGGGGPGGFGLNIVSQFIPGLGGGGGGQQGGRVETIRVVADPMSNALLVRAKPIDMLTIRRLLDKHIDVVHDDNLVTVRTHIIGPLKHANATDVADLLKSVYSTSMTSSTQLASGPGGGGFGGPGGGMTSRMSVDSGGSPRAALTVGVDNHTNSLYVSCSTALYDDIKKLVDNVEESSSNAKQAIKIISIQDIDPALVQQAVFAISGQQTASANQRRFQDTTSLAGGQGGNRFGGFGGNQGGGFGGGQGFGGGFPGGFGGGANIIMPGMGGFGGGGPGGFTGGGGFRGGAPGGGFGGGAPGGGFGGGAPGGGIRTTPGGGGGGGPIRGGGKGGLQSRGPDFFEQRVMDDPSVNVLYDPAEEQQHSDPVPAHIREALARTPSLEDRPVQLTSFLQPKELGSVNLIDSKGQAYPGSWTMTGSSITLTIPKVAIFSGRVSGDVISGTAVATDDKTKAWKFEVQRISSTSNEWAGTDTRPDHGKIRFVFSGAGPVEPTLNPPRLGVQIEVLPGLDLAIIRANTKEDLEAALYILRQLQENAKGAKVEIRMVPVRFQDVMQVTNQLNQLFGRVAFSPSSTVLIGGGVAAVVPGQTQQGLLPGGVTPSAVVPPPGATQARNMIFLPQPRLSSILVAAPASRMQEIVEHIHMFDQPNSANMDLTAIPLKRASAARVANALNTFYASRLPTGDNPPALSSVRVAWDDGTNTIFVQGSFQDVSDIRRFVEYIDDPNNNKANADLRVVQLRNAVAVDLAIVLQASIANGILSINAAQAAGGAAGAVAGGAIPGGGQGAQQGGLGIQQQFGLMFKDQRIKFVPSNSKEGKPIESAVFEDIRITPYALNNSLIVVAPEATMPLVLALIRDLDVPPNARSEINIFTLKRSDATQMATMLQQLFVGIGALGAGGTPGGAPAGGVPAGGAGTAGTQRAPVTMTIQAFTPEGAPIIDLRVTVDVRTNSIIVAGSRNDLLTVETIIDRIENAAIPRRLNDVVKLRNANALDVTNAINDYYTKLKGAAFTAGMGATASLQLMREVVATADPVSNSIMISATSEWFEEVLRLIAKLDTTPAQVLISVLIAEVTLNGNEEFGIEVGLQNPLMFTRTQLPGGATTGYSAAGTPPVSTYGFDFTKINGGAFPLTTGSNPNALSAQGITSLGVGRVSPRAASSGFVFSAANDSVSVLLRALKAQRRIDVLSRPTLMTLDQQSAVITVGQDIPYNNGSNATATGVISVAVGRKQLGVILQVTPQITPDGRILMRVIPEVSSIGDANFPLGNGQTSTSFNIQHLETTVSAYDGDTIMLGGMITKSDERFESKIPWFGDLPGIGAAFRFRLEERKKTELVIIMTPHIVRNREEAQMMIAEETRRIDWNLPDIMRVHGARNCTVFEPMLAQNMQQMQQQQAQTKPFRIIPNAIPGVGQTLPVMNQTPVFPVAPSAPKQLPPAVGTPPNAPQTNVQQVNVPAAAPLPAQTPASTPTAPAQPNINTTTTPGSNMPISSFEPVTRPTVRGGLLKNLFVPNRQANPETPTVAPQPQPSIPVREQVQPAPLLIPLREQTPAPIGADRIPVIVPSDPVQPAPIQR